jgi:two-component system chemotaxis response regulator CheY
MSYEMENERVGEIHVLVVDDHFPTRDMVKTILRSVGFTKISQADNGAAALMKVEEQNIDLVICDWNMPGTSGIEFLTALRSKDRYKNLPFLMLTAEAYRENVKQAIENGVTDYITKPFTAQVLTQKVLQTLGIKA